MNDAQIKHMVDRFLSWRLPADFAPDGGISFAPWHGAPVPRASQPIGTNLFTAEQAAAMVRYMLGSMPADDAAPVPMLLHCPQCKVRHIDEGAFLLKAHHTHACQRCGHVWRPAIVPTVGVRFLPGFKNDGPAT